MSEDTLGFGNCFAWLVEEETSGDGVPGKIGSFCTEENETLARHFANKCPYFLKAFGERLCG